MAILTLQFDLDWVEQVLIFESAGVDADSSFATIIIGLIQLGATFISTFLVDRAGRRMLLLISGAGMAASMASLGYHFFNNEFRGNF